HTFFPPFVLPSSIKYESFRRYRNDKRNIVFTGAGRPLRSRRVGSSDLDAKPNNLLIFSCQITSSKNLSRKILHVHKMLYCN
ncbi:MAG: hypothetical protein WAZ77_05610, partial [Candidatus Nitrosopolaris sp.]